MPKETIQPIQTGDKEIKGVEPHVAVEMKDSSGERVIYRMPNQVAREAIPVIEERKMKNS